MKNQIHDYLDHELKNLTRFRTIHPITALHHIMESMMSLLRDEYPGHPIIEDLNKLQPLIMEWNVTQQKKIYNHPSPVKKTLPKLKLPNLKKLKPIK
jgi:hypothetical protein|tara:strand:+ start:295 stop:585 length:291 start_codon:yes stop_codon:yes gene_type:complete